MARGSLLACGAIVLLGFCSGSSWEGLNARARSSRDGARYVPMCFSQHPTALSAGFLQGFRGVHHNVCGSSSGARLRPSGNTARGPARVVMMSSRQPGGEGRGENAKTMLFVGNLPWVLDSWGLEKLFEAYGKITSAKIAFDYRTDRSKGYGFVVFADEAAARRAQREMNGKPVGGRRIDVQSPGAPPRRMDGQSMGNIDMQAMRVNPAMDDSRYGMSMSAAESQEQAAFRASRAAMDLEFLSKFDDPYYNVHEDEWHPFEIFDDDNDPEFDWEDYKLHWDYWDPITQELKSGARFEPMRPNTSMPNIDWDFDWIADPVQKLSDGREYQVSDPARPVKEDFDRIFIENDKKRMEMLEDLRERYRVDGEVALNGFSDLDLDNMQPATRYGGEGAPGGGRINLKQQETNIVDPFGKRQVRRGLRERAVAQKGSIERMQEQDEVLSRVLGRNVGQTPGLEQYTGGSKEAPGESWGGGGGSSRWTVKRNDGAPPPSAWREGSPPPPGRGGGEGRGGYVPPKDGYNLGMPTRDQKGGESWTRRGMTPPPQPWREGTPPPQPAAWREGSPPPVRGEYPRGGVPPQEVKREGTPPVVWREGSPPPTQAKKVAEKKSGSAKLTPMEAAGLALPKEADLSKPELTEEADGPVKRARGRPRKDGSSAQSKAPTEAKLKEPAPDQGGESASDKPKKRGRPPKKASADAEQSESTEWTRAEDSEG